MITFLPCADFDAIARLLDDKRLGGQRTEAWSILKWLRSPDEYPKLVKAGYCSMWKGYEDALVIYVNAMLREWERRGKRNELLKPGDAALGLEEQDGAIMPPWLGEELLHSCHRHALMAKLPEHYGAFGWAETGDEYDGSYLWPEQVEEGSWVLRWPKATKRPTIPICVAVVAPSSSKPLRKGTKRGREQDEAAAAHGDKVSHAALVADWGRLTKEVLPKKAAEHRWPIRFDHCFQRVALDAAFGGCWYDHIDRKRGAAIKQMGTADLERAVAAARRMEEEGRVAVVEMDEQSLQWRGKQSKVSRARR